MSYLLPLVEKGNFSGLGADFGRITHAYVEQRALYGMNALVSESFQVSPVLQHFWVKEGVPGLAQKDVTAFLMCQLVLTMALVI